MGTQLVSNLELSCQSYVKGISSLDVVLRVLALEEEDLTTIWTVLEAPPFEDSVRQPIYRAQLQVLRDIKGGLALDFHVVNISELTKPEQLANIIPADAKTLWQR